MTSSDERPTVDAIRAREQAATPGPWAVESVRDGERVTFIVPDVVRWRGLTNSIDFGEDVSTALFIARARTDIPFLLDELAREQEQTISLLDALRRSEDALMRIAEDFGMGGAEGAYAAIAVAALGWCAKCGMPEVNGPHQEGYPGGHPFALATWELSHPQGDQNGA